VGCAEGEAQGYVARSTVCVGGGEMRVAPSLSEMRASEVLPLSHHDLVLCKEHNTPPKTQLIIAVRTMNERAIHPISCCRDGDFEAAS
jgi:hypothetical protein